MESRCKYRRLFIMRKDLNMSHGKLAAQIGHCAEAYWLNKICQPDLQQVGNGMIESTVTISVDEFSNYVVCSMVKTICEARNKSHLLKAKELALELGLREDEHFGLIYDKCFTELEPEEDDGTVLTGIWFCPLPDDVAHAISKKYQLYRD